MLFFRRDADFEAFSQVMIEAHLRPPIRILSYCAFMAQPSCVAQGRVKILGLLCRVLAEKGKQRRMTALI
jgi:hypothetical protein